MNPMARKNSRVPVANRAPRTSGKGKTLPHIRLTIIEVAILVFVLILLITLIGTPLRNYLQQRAEISRLESSIASMQVQKEELINDIEMYRSDAYIRELARTRLGVIEEGEYAFRVMDKDLQNSRQTTESEVQDSILDVPWYETLWNSVTEEDATQPAEVIEERHHLPIMPTEQPADPVAPEQVPAPEPAPNEADPAVAPNP